MEKIDEIHKYSYCPIILLFITPAERLLNSCKSKKTTNPNSPIRALLKNKKSFKMISYKKDCFKWL